MKRVAPVRILGDRRRPIDKEKLQYGEKSLNVDAGPEKTRRSIKDSVRG